MNIIFVITLFAVGLFLIIWGGNLLVDGAEGISKLTKIPEVVIGATIVSFVTTLPELMVTIFASAEGTSDMAVGNAVGSMFFNFLVIGGIIFILKPVNLNKKDFVSKIILLLVTMSVLIVFCLDGNVSWFNSFILLIIFVVYFIMEYVEAKRTLKTKNVEKVIMAKIDYEKPTKRNIAKTTFLLLLGGVMVVAGAKLMVDNGAKLGLLLGIGAHVVGITIISVGTSLPELITGIISIKKNTTQISLGNVLGANILNGTLLLGTSGLISSGNLIVKPEVCFIVLPILLICFSIFSVCVLLNKKCGKWLGILMLLSAISYYALLFFTI